MYILLLETKEKPIQLCKGTLDQLKNPHTAYKAKKKEVISALTDKGLTTAVDSTVKDLVCKKETLDLLLKEIKNRNKKREFILKSKSPCPCYLF